MSTNGSAPLPQPPLAEPAAALRVLVVDDHDLFRSGMCALLAERGFEIVADTADGEAAVERARRLRPDVVVVGLELSRLSGAETVRRLGEALPGVRTVGFAIAPDEHTIEEGISAGLDSYLLKDAGVEEIVEGIRATAAGQSVLAPRAAAVVVRRLRAERRDPAKRKAPLTERESEVLSLLVAGKSNAAIAAALFISPPTAKNHIASILDKLGADNRIQAAVEAVRRGWA